MLPFGIGFTEVLVIVVVLLLVVGPQKLPDIARSVGKGVRMLRRAAQELRDAVDVDDIKREVYADTRRAWEQDLQPDDVEPVDGGYAALAARERPKVNLEKPAAASAAAPDAAGPDPGPPGDGRVARGPAGASPAPDAPGEPTGDEQRPPAAESPDGAQSTA